MHPPSCAIAILGAGTLKLLLPGGSRCITRSKVWSTRCLTRRVVSVELSLTSAYIVYLYTSYSICTVLLPTSGTTSTSAPLIKQLPYSVPLLGLPTLPPAREPYGLFRPTSPCFPLNLPIFPCHGSFTR